MIFLSILTMLWFECQWYSERRKVERRQETGRTLKSIVVEARVTDAEEAARVSRAADQAAEAAAKTEEAARETRRSLAAVAIKSKQEAETAMKMAGPITQASGKSKSKFGGMKKGFLG